MYGRSPAEYLVVVDKKSSQAICLKYNPDDPEQRLVWEDRGSHPSLLLYNDCYDTREEAEEIRDCINATLQWEVRIWRRVHSFSNLSERVYILPTFIPSWLHGQRVSAFTYCVGGWEEQSVVWAIQPTYTEAQAVVASMEDPESAEYREVVHRQANHETVCPLCGKSVELENDAVALQWVRAADLIPRRTTRLMEGVRHLLPTGDCPGDRALAQYLEGQRKDPYDSFYEPMNEQGVRTALPRLQELAAQRMALRVAILTALEAGIRHQVTHESIYLRILDLCLVKTGVEIAEILRHEGYRLHDVYKQFKRLEYSVGLRYGPRRIHISDEPAWVSGLGQFVKEEDLPHLVWP